MATATITSKGQVTLPKEVRDSLGVSAGDRINFVRAPDGRYAIVPASRSVTHLRGVGPRPATAVTLDEMEAAIQAGAARR